MGPLNRFQSLFSASAVDLNNNSSKGAKGRPRNVLARSVRRPKGNQSGQQVAIRRLLATSSHR